MANKKNLEKGKATRFKSGEEAVKNGRKGGIASGKAKRARKTLKDELLTMLAVEGVQERIAAALIKEAIEGNSQGSVTKAFSVIRDTIGEKPVEKSEATVHGDAPIAIELKGDLKRWAK